MLLVEYLLAALATIRQPKFQHGATLIEYVLIVAVIAIAVFAASQAGLVSAITGVFTSAQECISGSCS